MSKRTHDDVEEIVLDEGDVNMASPMQDTVVSSTVTSVNSPSYSIENNFQCDTIQKLPRSKYKIARIRKMSNCQSNSTQNCEFWLSDYDKDIERIAGSTTYEVFQRYLVVYAKNVAKDALTWNSDNSKLDNLRRHISHVLLYYYFHWYIWKEKVRDYFYLQKISDILVTYVDLELKLFNRNPISENEMSNKLLYALCIYLEDSEEHILNVLLKSKLVRRENKNIFSPIFEKCFANVVAKNEKLSTITYIRYSLALKLWKSINNSKRGEAKIKTLAIQILGSQISPLEVDFKNLDFFPQPPKTCKNDATWFLQTKSFDLKTIIKTFFKHIESLHQSTISNDLKIIEECENCYHIQVHVSPPKIRRQNSLKKKKSPSKILVVDLTKDDEEEIIEELVKVDDQSNNQKKVTVVKRNLKWLEHIITRMKRKSLDRSKCTSESIGIADSTDSERNPADKASVDLPISDNEVTESYKFDSKRESCDNLGDNIPIPSDSDNISQNSDTTKDKENQNSEISEICSICSGLIGNCICGILIDYNLLSNATSSDLSETKFTRSDLDVEHSQEVVPSTFDYDLPFELFTDELSYSEMDVVDPLLTKTRSPPESHTPYTPLRRKDSLLAPFKPDQLLTEITEYGIYRVENNDSTISNEESPTTSSDTFSNLYPSRLNPETLIDFTSLPFAENFISDDEHGYCIENIFKLDDTIIEIEEVIIEDKPDSEVFENLKSTGEEMKIQHRRKRSSTSEKIQEPPSQKIKVPEFFDLDNNIASSSCLKQENKLEDEMPVILSESVGESSEKLSSKFLTQNIPLQNQQPNKRNKISTFQNLADCIKSDENNKIITFFDSECSILKQLTFKKLRPSSCHYFIRLLCEKGLLLHHYTGNKGEFEKEVGISEEKFTVLPDDIQESFSFQTSSHFSLATLLIFFTNRLACLSKWLKGKCPKLFIIQETTVEIDTNLASPSDFIATPLKDLQLDINIKFEVIRAQTLERGCKLLIKKLGWSEELKKFAEIA